MPQADWGFGTSAGAALSAKRTSAAFGLVLRLPCSWQQGTALTESRFAGGGRRRLFVSTVKPRDTGALSGRYPAIDAVRNEPGRLEISGQGLIHHPLGDHVDTPATVWHPSHQCDPDPVA
jgi:hypothetical protein